jgi:ribokinase
MTILVFGSLNMDLVVRSPRFPKPGETLSGESFFTAPGGKGGNQAVACARLGAPTQMIGRVGDDVFGSALCNSLADNGVKIDKVMVDAKHASGVALITVDALAENTIVIVPGANGAISFDDVARLDSLLAANRLILLQLEIPLEAVVAAAEVAHDHGFSVILDPAPARPLSSELYSLVDILTPNETEAAALTGLPLDTDDSIEQAAEVLLTRGVRNVVIKLGGRGVYARSRTQPQGQFWPAFSVAALDTVAAGDAFNGGLAVALANECSFEEAVRWGQAAGAISTTRPGAQPSIPNREEVLALLAANTLID